MATDLQQIPYEFHPGPSHPLFLIRSHLFRSIQRYAPTLKGRMMDFGCGLKPYEALFSVSEYVGVDYQGEGETYHQEKVDVFYNGKSLPFPDGHFDAIFSSEVFEHVFNLAEILPELYRVLKPGGRMLITCPFVFGEHEVPADFARYTSFALKHVLEQEGFQIEAQEKTGGYVEVMTQLRIVYWNRYILSAFDRVPVVRTLVKKGFFLVSNIMALVLRRLLPFRQDLYLNNIVLALKPAP